MSTCYWKTGDLGTWWKDFPVSKILQNSKKFIYLLIFDKYFCVNVEGGFNEELFLSLDADDFAVMFNTLEGGWKLRFNKAFNQWKQNYVPPDQPPLMADNPRSSHNCPNGLNTSTASSASNTSSRSLDEPEGSLCMGSSSGRSLVHFIFFKINSCMYYPSGFIKIKDLLEKTWEGKLILSSFQKTSTTDMRSLCRIIVNNEFDRLNKPKSVLIRCK